VSPSCRCLVLLAVVVALVAGEPRAHADVPQARLAFGTGLRINRGELGKDFLWGWQIVHVEAGLQPFAFGKSSTVRFGVGWWTTISRYTASSADAVDAQVSMLQMGVGPRLETMLPIRRYPISVHFQAGYEFMRTSHPVPPDDSGTYHLFAVQGGVALGTGASFYGVTVLAEPLPSGPTGFFVLAYVGLGSI
jgi:hypothetical protein